MNKTFKLWEIDKLYFNKYIFDLETSKWIVEKHQDKISKGQLLGTINEYNFLLNDMTGLLELESVSHIVNKLWIEDAHVMVDIFAIDTPKGELLKKCISSDVVMEAIPKGIYLNDKNNFGDKSFELHSINVAVPLNTTIW
jgi:hypothetical protein